MEGILELLPSVLDGHSDHQLENYLDTCEEHVAFHGREKKNDAYVKLVNIRLNENEKRFEGLLILKVVLRQCSVEVFVDNAKSWMSHCLKGSFDKNSAVANASFGVLGTLLKTAVKFPEIKKHASANIVPSFLEHSKRDINAKTIHSLLECLAVCIQEYSGPCGESSRFVLNLLTRLLDAEPRLLSLAAKCYALLSQVKGKGRDGVPLKNIWKTNQLVLIHTLHYHLDLLYSNVDEIQTAHRPAQGNIELLITKKMNENSSASERMQQIAKSINGLSKFLQAMLLGNFPVAKTIMPDVIIGLICRGLAVTCQSLGNITTDALALGSVLPDVHTHLLNILISLITCCGRNLIPYGSIICKLLNQELKWTCTTEWPYALDKPFRNLRSTVYSCLQCWLTIAKSASSIELVIEEIVQYILQDVRVNKPVVTLKAKSGPHMKNQAQYNFLSDSRSDKLGIKLANRGLCLHALKCLQLVIYSSTTYMKSTLCKIIQESIVTLLFEVQNTHDGPPVPYSDGACRKELYSVLLALCMEPHPVFPPPVNYALSIFKSGLTDPLSEISVLCIAALSNLEKIIHPSAPPVGSTLQYDTVQEFLGDIADKNDFVLLNSTSGSSPPSIKDMPLSAFPNLNNVIVVKVFDNKNDVKENKEKNCGFNSSDSDTQTPGVSTSGLIGNNKYVVQKTTIKVNGMNTFKQNCNLGDIISMDNNFSGDMYVENSGIDNCIDKEIKNDVKDVVSGSSNSVPKPCEKVSLFEKINGVSDDVEEENISENDPVISSVNLNSNHLETQEPNQNCKLLETEEPNQNCKLSDTEEPLSVVNESDLSLSEGPPTKKAKVSYCVNGIEADTKTDVENKEIDLANSENDIVNGIEVETKTITDNKEIGLINSENDKINGETNSIHDEDEMMNCFVDVVQE